MESDMKTRVTITSDFLCPWCYLAQARLLKVVAECGDAVEVEFLWLPFELNPTMPAEGMDRKEYRSRKFGWERSQQMDAHLEVLGEADGVIFNFSRISRAPNTRLAHRLHVFASQHGYATEYARRVFRAYFEQGLDIGSPYVLGEIAGSLGLPHGDAERYLLGSAGLGLADVITAEKAVALQEVESVPQIQIGRYRINGAQASSVMRDALLLTAATSTAAALESGSRRND